MSITIERDQLLPAISAASRAGDKAAQIPILKHILLTPRPNSLEVVGTDLDIRLETKVAAQSDGTLPPPTTVNGDALMRILSGFPEGSHVSLAWLDEAHAQIELKCGRSRYKLQSLPASDYPDGRKMERASAFSMAGKDLSTALKFVRPFAVADLSRPYLASAFMHLADNKHAAFGGGKGKHLIFIATTAKELARYSMPLPKGIELPEMNDQRGVMFPEAMLDQIIKFVGNTEDEIEIEVAKNLIALSCRGDVLSTVLVDGTYPDYNKAVPAGPFTEATVDALELTAALQRLCSIGNDSRAQLDLSAGSLKLTLINPDLGSAEEDIEVEYAGEPRILGIRGKGMLSVLDVLDCDIAVLRFDEDFRVILINAKIGGKVDYSRTVLTMRVER